MKNNIHKVHKVQINSTIEYNIELAFKLYLICNSNDLLKSCFLW